MLGGLLNDHLPWPWVTEVRQKRKEFIEAVMPTIREARRTAQSTAIGLFLADSCANANLFKGDQNFLESLANYKDEDGVGIPDEEVSFFKLS